MSKTPQKFNFEKTLEKLESIVQELESSDTSLDKSIEKYEQSIELYKMCQDYLAKAQKKVHLLSESLNEEELEVSDD